MVKLTAEVEIYVNPFNVCYIKHSPGSEGTCIVFSNGNKTYVSEKPKDVAHVLSVFFENST